MLKWVPTRRNFIFYQTNMTRYIVSVAEAISRRRYDILVTILMQACILDILKVCGLK